jgi:hypothetical protein
MHIIKINKSVYPGLYQTFIQNKDKLINYNDYYVILFDYEAAKLVDCEAYQKLIASPICPVCGCHVTTGLMPYYRNNDSGRVEKYVACPGCIFLDDKNFDKLNNTPMEYKAEEFLKIITTC